MKKSPFHCMIVSIPFSGNNYIICILLFTVMIVQGCDYFFPPFSDDKITVQEASDFLKKHSGDPDIVLLDIRTKHEYDSLKIEKSVNLDFSDPKFPEMIEKLDKTKRYIIIDNNGTKSAMAYELLKEQKFTKVNYISGGIIEWTKTFPLNR